MKNKLLRSISFITILIVIFMMLSYLFKPIWRDWNNYDTFKGFYDQPDNTLETIFVGASIVINGVTPVELYRDYGICSYNLASEQQPMIASCYWTKEAYRLHPETLDTVVLDASSLRRTPGDAFFKKGIDGMRLSKNKWDAVGEYTDSNEDRLINLFPLLEYHSKWSTLTQSDFEKDAKHYNGFLRGYNFDSRRYIDSTFYKNIAIPVSNPDAEAEESRLDEQSLYYLKKIIDFCTEKNIRLVMIKTPGQGHWSSSDHKAVARIAKDYNLDFLDFNYEPLYSELDYNHALDNIDLNHGNYSGAAKLTSCLGKYLVEKCGNRDIRGDERFLFLEDELARYEEYIEKLLIPDKINRPEDYLDFYLSDGENTIFITARDDAAGALTGDQRERFKGLGLVELSELGFRDSYVGIIDASGTIVELREKDPGEPKNESEDISPNDLNAAGSGKNPAEETKGNPYLNYVYNPELGVEIELKSGGLYLGNVSSCIIAGKEYSGNSRGLNIIVCNKSGHEVIGTRTFDTCASPTDYKDIAEEYNDALALNTPLENMSDKVRELYLYNRECDVSKELEEAADWTGEDSFLKYLKYFMNRDNTIIYISGMDDASSAISYEMRQYLRGIGMRELAGIQFGDSYIAIINNGSVEYEKSDHGDAPIEASGLGYKIVSAGQESGNVSSIMLKETEVSNGAPRKRMTEYSSKGRGLNIAVYDTILDRVISSENFDTCGVEMALPDD